MQPFYIEQFTSGLDISKEDRLISGFSTLDNARVEKGKLIKRIGYSLLATAADGNPIVGIDKQWKLGPGKILVATTRRLYWFEPADNTLTEITTTGTFTGSDWQFFQFTSWQGKTYMSNWHDGIYVTDGNTVSLLDTGDTVITRAHHIFVWKNRLFVIDTVENGNEEYHQRLRWSDVLGGSDPTKINFTSTNWVDGEFQGTDDVPMLVRFFRGVPYVFFKQFVVPLQASRVADNPFAWGSPIEQWGSISQNFGVPTKNGIMFLNQRNIDIFDGYRGQSVDLPGLRDFVDTMDNRKWHYITGTYAGETDRVYMSYAEDGQDIPNKVLEFDILDNTFSTASIPLNYVWGFDGWYAPEHTVAANVYDDDYALDGNFNPANLDMASTSQLRTTPTTFGGDQSGRLFDLNSGTDYNTGNIAFSCVFPTISPFTERGKRTRLHRIEILVDNDSTASFTLSIFKEEATSAYKTFTVSCDGKGDKFWAKKFVGGEVADSFQIKVSHDTTANSPVIHAARLWLSEGGEIWAK